MALDFTQVNNDNYKELMKYIITLNDKLFTFFDNHDNEMNYYDIQEVIHFQDKLNHYSTIYSPKFSPHYS